MIAFDNQSFDAKEWAKEFMGSKTPINEENMTTWFSNALMAGFDYAQNEMDNCSSDLVFVNGFCLKREKKTKFFAPKDIIGTLFSCPFCGIIRDNSINSFHVFNPSKPLLSYLEKCNTIKNFYTIKEKK